MPRSDRAPRVNRRRFVQAAAITGLGLLAGCGRQSVPRIGYLEVKSATMPLTQTQTEAFQQGLRDHGYVDGQNIAIEWRYADGTVDRLPGLAAELAQLPVDLIVAVGSSPTRAAQNATSTIPIVWLAASNPVRPGYADSLARPGGNLTGISEMSTELNGKRMELLKEAVPGAALVAVLRNPAILLDAARDLQMTENAAQQLGVRVQVLDVQAPKDFEAAFETATRERVDALLVQNNFLANAYQAQIASLAARSRLPTMGGYADFPANGGLMAYGPNQAETFRRGATYVDRILKGTKPAELPIEQPMRFDFVINLQTAQALGLTIPQHVLLQATEIIQ